MLLTVAVEGPSDEAVMRKLCEVADLGIARVHVPQGKPRLDKNLPGYNNAARLNPWLVVRDLDHDAACAPELVRKLLPNPAPYMTLRVPVRSIEAWLLADSVGMAEFLGISERIIPPDVEALPRPKRTLVDLAGRSRNRTIRGDIVPEPGMSREVGTGYTAQLIGFVRNHWDPERGALRSPSLASCLRRLVALRGA